jgi:hypothetical protein
VVIGCFVATVAFPVAQPFEAHADSQTTKGEPSQGKRQRPFPRLPFGGTAARRFDYPLPLAEEIPMWNLTFSLLTAVLVGVCTSLTALADDANKPAEASKPLTYKDAGTGILVYVESDRRHAAALDKDGKVLWHKDVVEAAKVRPLRPDRPAALVHVGKPLDWRLKVMKERKKEGDYVTVSFSDKSFGLPDLRSGEYTLMGSD